MPDDPSVHTTQLHLWLERMRAGDGAARDELLHGVCGRLERVAHKMLRGFPNVRCWAQTDDILQSALMRLLRTLEKLQPASMREFFGLAAAQLRRELLDLARHFARANGLGAAPGGPPADGAPVPEPVAPAEEPEELERWCRFHEEAEQLPVEEREVVGLIFYHGWPQADVAALLGVTVRTVQRRWQSALFTLHHVLKDA